MTDDKPKALRYADALADAEQRIVEALSFILDGLIARAKDGDTKAATYLLDRVMGRIAGAKTAPADDREIPYSEAAFRLEKNEHESKERLRRMLSQLGA